MKVPVILNGTKSILEGPAEEVLLKNLQKNTEHSVKSGCLNGLCGVCTVLINDKPAAACKLPIGILKNSDIVTLDYFSKTEEYKSIQEGFEKAGIHLCGYCNAGKFFCAYEVLKINKKSTRKEIADYVKHLSPCCVDLDTLVNGIIYAIAINDRKQARETKGED